MLGKRFIRGLDLSRESKKTDSIGLTCALEGKLSPSRHAPITPASQYSFDPFIQGGNTPAWIEPRSGLIALAKFALNLE